jgi:hypothetical protein
MHFHIHVQFLAKSGAAMIRKVRRLVQDHGVQPKNIRNFDEIRIYSSPQDLNTFTLELASVHDPLVKKIQNPKEAFTGIIMVNGDGSDLMIFLVTKKKLPDGYPIHSLTLDQRSWDAKEKTVKVENVIVRFAVIHGITVLKVPPGAKAWCSGIISEAYLRMALFKTNQPSILQVLTKIFCYCNSFLK